MAIKKMNGKDLKYQGFCDFDDPFRWVATGRHTEIAPWQRQMKRAVRQGWSLYGWVWIEWPEYGVPGTFAVKGRLEELVLRPQQRWADAKERAFREFETASILVGDAACCLKLVHCGEDHKKTVRHFFYWVMDNQASALDLWPWMRELIAEEVLTGDA